MPSSSATGQPPSFSNPAWDAAAVTPNDSTDLGQVRAIYVGTSGDVKVTTGAGTDVTFVAVPVGVLPVQVRKVWSTGTTADDIVALY